MFFSPSLRLQGERRDGPQARPVKPISDNAFHAAAWVVSSAAPVPCRMA